MARNTSFIGISGTLGGLTFYTANGKQIVKTKNTPDSNAIKKSPRYARMRENMRELGGASTVGKAFREAFSGVARLLGDGDLHWRANSRFKTILNNGAGVRGEREMNLAEFGGGLRGFELNGTVSFGTRFFAPAKAPVVSADRDNLQWTVSNFDTNSCLKSPAGATHFKLVLAAGFVSNHVYSHNLDAYEPTDYEVNGIGSVAFSAAFEIGGMVGTDVFLEVDSEDIGVLPATAVLIGCVGILFLQEINDDLYALKQGHAMRVAVVG